MRRSNPTPDAIQFRQALKIVSVAQYMKCPEKANCEDDRQFLADFLDPVDENSGDCNDSDITDKFIELEKVALTEAQVSSLYP